MLRLAWTAAFACILAAMYYSECFPGFVVAQSFGHVTVGFHPSTVPVGQEQMSLFYQEPGHV